MAEQWTVKTVDGVDPSAATPEVKEEPTVQEKEQAVVEEAIADTPNVEIPDDGVIKVNLDEPLKPKEDVEQVSDESQEQSVETPNSESTEEEPTPIERIEEPSTTEDVVEETPEVKEEIIEQVAEQPKEVQAELNLPENVEKLVKFMDETGGSVEDFVSLNKNYTDMSDSDIVREYYKTKYPHYNEDRITRRMAKEFLFDEEQDDVDKIQDKKDAFNDTVFDAKKYLEDRKSKYYDELKFNKSNEVPAEYQKALEVEKAYQQSQEANHKLQQTFIEKTNTVFNDEFKGFDFKVGESKYRYKVNEPGKVKEYQSDINNFVQEFLGQDGTIADAAGYHKAMFAAKNADKLAQHFYEQGRAEAIKQSAAEAKNIDMKPRQDMSANVITKSGTKVRVVDQAKSGKLRFKNYSNR